jgi:hypothetical protein
LAGRATLDRLELTPAEGVEGQRYKKILFDAQRIQDYFLQMFRQRPRKSSYRLGRSGGMIEPATMVAGGDHGRDGKSEGGVDAPAMVAPTGRRQHDEQYWRSQVEAWRSSGLTQSEYCRRGGVHWYGFRYWKSKLDAEAAGEPEDAGRILVAVKVPARAGSDAAEIRIRVGGGPLIEVRPRFDIETLRKVLAVLGGR